MHRITVDIDNAALAKNMAALLRNFNFVKNVEIEKSDKTLSASDWAKPGRPATDEEIEQLMIEMEEDTGAYTPEEARVSVKKRILTWRNRKK